MPLVELLIPLNTAAHSYIPQETHLIQVAWTQSYAYFFLIKSAISFVIQDYFII